MAQALVAAVDFEGMRAVTGSIVGEDGVRLGTVLMEEVDGTLKKGCGGVR